MSKIARRWLVLAIAALLALVGCADVDIDDEFDDDEQPGDAEATESVGQVSSELLGFRVAPSLEGELTRINNTPTGRNVVSRARARGLHTIRVGPLRGNIVGLYTSNGVITIESPNSVYTFQRLAHELLHASGHRPHYFPDKGLIGDMCRQARARCPSWN